jgi:hypothetical protein
MKNYVAAKGLNCNCVFCRTCLVQKEILYATNSVISHKQAKREALTCSGCGCTLHLQKESKPPKQNKTGMFQNIS